MQVSPPKTYKHLKHQIHQSVIPDITSQVDPAGVEGKESYAGMGNLKSSPQLPDHSEEMQTTQIKMDEHSGERTPCRTPLLLILFVP